MARASSRWTGGILSDSHTAPASGMDYAEHERTYRNFLKFAKWGTISVAVLLILMAYFLL